MAQLRDTSEFLHLFSEVDGLKFLTHDHKSSGVDLVDYIYRCQRTILDRRSSVELPNDIYDLVRGFVFGPSWTDYKGEEHTSFVSSEDWVECYDSTGEHPANNPAFADEVQAFRDSIRFRRGKFEKFIQSLESEYPRMEFIVSKSLKGADFYTDVQHVMQAIREIISSMNEYPEHPCIHVEYNEDELDDGSTKCVITIEQVGSFPGHTLLHDQRRLQEGGGTLASIRTSLEGYATWSIESRWGEDDTFTRWNILREPGTAEVEQCYERGSTGPLLETAMLSFSSLPFSDSVDSQKRGARGFKHIITILNIA